jgi:hypothetical protein
MFRVGFVGCVLAGRLLGCSCLPDVMAPACEKLGKMHAIFVGRVLEVEADATAGPAMRAELYRFAVETAYKGLAAEVKEVVIDPDNYTTCRARYTVGKRYLVYATQSRRGGRLVSANCHGSRRVEFAGDDIAYLESYRRGETGNFVYGRVLQGVPGFGRPVRGKDAPVEGAKVVLRRGEETWSQSSAPDGEFRFENLPAGQYTLSAELAPYVGNPGALPVEVPATGCAQMFPVLEARAILAGVLVDASGSPAGKMPIDVLRRHPNGNWTWIYPYSKTTNALGEFLIENLPAGDYLVGYSIGRDYAPLDSPYTTTYFPGVRERERAEVVRAGPREAVRDLRIRLGKPQTPRAVRVEVVWPDGSLPGKHRLQLFHHGEAIRTVEEFDFHVDPDARKGIFQLMGYEEREHLLEARYWVDEHRGPVPWEMQRVARSEVVRLAPGMGPVRVRLVLTKTLRMDEE